MIPSSMRIHFALRIALLGLFFTLGTLPANAQCHKQTLQSGLVCEDENPPSSSRDTAPTQDSDTNNTSMSIKKVILNLPGDQKRIWTSPFHLHLRDSVWLLPLAATTGVLIGSDPHSMVRERSTTNAVNLSTNVSNGGLAALITLPALMYTYGSLQGSPKARETGLLSGEALVNSLIVDEALKT
ncbi:MAG TPA: hypothetical protein VI685_21935, partial [Candidatus Angelobacter sp.]